jgi:hypothetical protein
MHPDEAPSQEPTNQPPPNQPTTQALPVIDEGPEHETFGDVESASRPPCGFWRIDDQQLDI